MKTFRMKVDLTCPSDWTLELAEAYQDPRKAPGFSRGECQIKQQLLSSKEEKDSLHVEEITPNVQS